MTRDGEGVLAGRVCVVTGASRGIGRITAARLASAGATVILAARDLSACEQAARQITAGGGAASAIAVDVTDDRSVADLYATVAEHHGGLDICVNNAGGVLADDADPISTPLDTWRADIELNLTGTFACVKYQLPHLLSSGGGAIVNVSGTCALLGSATPQIAYDCAKAGVLALTRDVAVAYARQGIRCNAVCPGPIEGELISGILGDPRTAARRLEHIPSGRFGTADEVADAILFLAGDTAGWTTGVTLTVDGGISIAYNTRP